MASLREELSEFSDKLARCETKDLAEKLQIINQLNELMKHEIELIELKAKLEIDKATDLLKKNKLIEKLKHLSECKYKELVHSEAIDAILEYIGDDKVSEALGTY